LERERFAYNVMRCNYGSKDIRVIINYLDAHIPLSNETIKLKRLVFSLLFCRHAVRFTLFNLLNDFHTVKAEHVASCLRYTLRGKSFHIFHATNILIIRLKLGISSVISTRHIFIPILMDGQASLRLTSNRFLVNATWCFVGCNINESVWF
jgi:hypothetical protein